MLNFFHWRVDFAAAFTDCTAFDEIIFAVDDAAESPRPLPVDVHVLMRNERAAFNDSEVQFLVDEIIFAENVFGGVLVVKKIGVGHKYSSSRAILSNVDECRKIHVDTLTRRRDEMKFIFSCIRLKLQFYLNRIYLHTV